MSNQGREVLGRKNKRKGSITSFLNKKYGGKWKYDGWSAWFCDDGIRVVRKVASDISCGSENRWFGARYYLYYLDERNTEVVDV